MGRPFESEGTRIRVRLDSQERQLLARLFDEVAELLDDGRRPGGDPLAELVGFDLQLPDDVNPAGDDAGRGTARAGGPYPDRLGPGADPFRADGELDGDLCAKPDPDFGDVDFGDVDFGDVDFGDVDVDDVDVGGHGDADGGGEEDVAGPEDDPALARLLPSGHRDDPELAAEFRRLTESGLRARKRSNLSLASAALQRKGQVVLSREEAGALLKGLTDTRLVLGERLGLRTDEDADMITEVLRRRGGSDDPWVSAALLYDVLTWWQEALVSALSR
jgi:hypothetical protein